MRGPCNDACIDRRSALNKVINAHFQLENWIKGAQKLKQREEKELDKLSELFDEEELVGTIFERKS